MNAISEIMAMPSPYRGSETSAATVKEESRRRFGDKIANEYNPKLCRSFREWRKILYTPIPGSKAVKVITIVEKTNDKGEIVKKFPKIVNLFNVNQVKRLRQ